jgi:spore maturation protein CgeB
VKKPKLLHIALGQHNTGLWREFEKEFEVVHIDWTIKMRELNNLQREILDAFHSFHPDVVFMQIQNENIVFAETVQKMAGASKVYSWTGDVRFPIPPALIETGQHITSTLFTNMFDVNEMLRLGHRADFLQVGFDEHTFTPVGATGDYPEIVFLGSNYSADSRFPLTPLRAEMVKALNSVFGVRFGVYGGGWKEMGLPEVFLKPAEEAMCYRTAKVCINLSHFNYGRYSSDRMFRMMGSGGFVLTHDFKGIEKDFVIGKHLATWHNLPDLIEKVKYYLEHNYQRENIRMEGCFHARQNHTWRNFVLNFKQMANL